MISRQLEQLARERNAERDAQTAKVHAARSTAATQASQPAHSGIRSRTGWAIVAIGLRIAESGNR